MGSGTRLRFHRGLNVEWQEADELSDDDSDDETMMPSSPSLKVENSCDLSSFFKILVEAFRYISVLKCWSNISNQLS